jgi:hypothetical protein
MTNDADLVHGWHRVDVRDAASIFKVDGGSVYPR